MLPDARGRRSICGAQTPGAHKRNSEAVAQKERRCVPALPAIVRLNPDGVEGLFVTLPLVTSDRGPFVLPQGTDRQADLFPQLDAKGCRKAPIISMASGRQAIAETPCRGGLPHSFHGM